MVRVLLKPLQPLLMVLLRLLLLSPGHAESIVPVLEAAPLAVARVTRQQAKVARGGVKDVDAFVALTHQVGCIKEVGCACSSLRGVGL